jgi:hypothetical protein
LARSRGGNRSSAMAPTTLCIVAFTVEIIPDSVLSCGSTGSESEQKKASLGRSGLPAQRRHFTTSPINAGPAIATVMSTSHAMR